MKILYWLLLFPTLVCAQQLIDCVQPSTPCVTSHNVGTGNSGDQAWLAFGKSNANFLVLAPVFSSATGTLLGNNSGINGPASALTALPFTAQVAQGGTGAVTLTGPLKGNGSSAFTAAASADIIGLWTGSCSSSTFLRGDGSCQSAGGTTLAFSALTSATNTTAAMVIGTGASLAVSGSGTNAATSMPTTGLSGALQAAQEPAHTGDMTNSAASLATTVVALNGTNLGGLSTGLLRNTTSTGVPSSAELSGDATTSGSNAVTVVKINGTALSGLSTGLLRNTISTGVPSSAELSGDAVTAGSNVVTVNALNGKAVKVLYQSGIHFILQGTMTVGNNCAISAMTAMPTTYAHAYILMPANGVATGVPAAATWYYFVASSTTAGTCYNNTYTSGTPTVPGSPTAFSTTHSGTETNTLATAYPGPSVTVAANSMGANGGVDVVSQWATNNSANVHSGLLKFNTTNCSLAYITSGVAQSDNMTLANNGATNDQTCFIQAAAVASVYMSVDTTSAQTLAVTITLNTTATDFMVMEYLKLTEWSN